ncbi:MAG: hypothetical protein ACHQRM_14385 [Bacteroidia bacterium]
MKTTNKSRIVLDVDADQREMIIELISSHSDIDYEEAEDNLDYYIVGLLIEKFEPILHLVNVDADGFHETFEDYLSIDQEEEEEEEETEC